MNQLQTEDHECVANLLFSVRFSCIRIIKVIVFNSGQRYVSIIVFYRGLYKSTNNRFFSLKNMSTSHISLAGSSYDVPKRQTISLYYQYIVSCLQDGKGKNRC